MSTMQTRRRFLMALSLASAARFVPARPGLAAEALPETTSVRFVKNPVICIAPQYAAAELLYAEGFTDIGYVETTTAGAVPQAIARGDADFSLGFAVNHIQAIDAGAPIAILAGVHVGCYELFASEGIRSIVELKGKSVGLKAASPALLSLMATHVGLDPAQDIRWVTGPKAGEDRRLPRVSPGAPRIARPPRRPCNRQHDGRPSMVAVFLLHARCQSGLRP